MDSPFIQLRLQTPLGPCWVDFQGKFLTRLYWLEYDTEFEPTTEDIHPPAKELQTALDHYFANRQQEWNKALEHIPILATGTAFQDKVWEGLRTIPWGTTLSYGELAQGIGKPNGARCVGMACAVNPLPFLVPCHRVISASGKISGFSAGVWRKEWLLKHEGVRLKA